MAAQVEYGWQSERTLTECMRYMLDNEISTDVCFEVGPSDGEIVTFRAHKYVLIARSPVFEAMFSSGMLECSGPEARVRIEDIDAIVFKEVLNYIYSETMSVSPDTAVQMMYAAKKYMLSKLVAECRKYFWEILNVYNVIDILNQSLYFDDQSIKNDCLRLISVNARAVFTGAEILSASPQAMDAILELKCIPVSELVVYESSIKWAKSRLHSATPEESPEERPTDQQIREALGDLLYKIRFPAMKPTEFAKISAENNVLTAEEKQSVCRFSATRTKDDHLRFPIGRRIKKETWVDRAVNCVISQCHSIPCLDAIDFKTTQDVLLTGLGLYAAESEKGYDVDVEILLSTNSLFKKKVPVPCFSDSSQLKIVKIVMKEPIAIQAGVLHTVKTFCRGHTRHCGQMLQAVCTTKAVTFKFVKHSQSPTTCETRGQIPQFYYCVL